jgi:hypothetical protein
VGRQGSSVADHPGARERGLGGAFGRVLGDVFADGTPVDSARKAAAGDAVAGLLFDPLGAAVDGAAEFDLLLRWFVGLGVDDAVWDPSTFSKNRDRLLEGDVAAKFMSVVLDQPRVKRLLSTDHFSVDGTLIEAWASMKSFRPKDGSDEPPALGFSHISAPPRHPKQDERIVAAFKKTSPKS